MSDTGSPVVTYVVFGEGSTHPPGVYLNAAQLSEVLFRDNLTKPAVSTIGWLVDRVTAGEFADSHFDVPSGVIE